MIRPLRQILLEDLDLVFFDLETTGGHPSTGAILEIAAIRMNSQEEVQSTFHSLIKPPIPIPPFIQSMTGLTPEFLRSSPSITEILPDFLEFKGDAPLISHGVMNDFSFIQNAQLRATGEMIEAWKICSHRLVQMAFPENPQRSLKAMAEHFGLTFHQKHRALDDAIMTGQVFWKTIQSLSLKTLEDLCLLLGDKVSLDLLGPGLENTEIESFPESSGLCTFLNSQKKSIYHLATPNIKETVAQFKTFKQNLQIDKVISESRDVSYQQTSLFMEAVLMETSLDVYLWPKRKHEFLKIVHKKNSSEPDHQGSYKAILGVPHIGEKAWVWGPISEDISSLISYLHLTFPLRGDNFYENRVHALMWGLLITGQWNQLGLKCIRDKWSLISPQNVSLKFMQAVEKKMVASRVNPPMPWMFGNIQLNHKYYTVFGNQFDSQPYTTQSEIIYPQRDAMEYSLWTEKKCRDLFRFSDWCVLKEGIWQNL